MTQRQQETLAQVDGLSVLTPDVRAVFAAAAEMCAPPHMLRRVLAQFNALQPAS